MHGLINRSIQCFIRDTYGEQAWSDIALQADLGVQGFEAMFTYEDALTERTLNAAQLYLKKPREALLEDLGTYLVSHPNVESLRRLLRFSGETFVDFLHSLDELPERALLAVPDLELPRFSLEELEAGAYSLSCEWHFPGFAHVLVGLLRTLADDYGTLAYLEFSGSSAGREDITIHLLDSGFASGRSFDLAAGA